MWPVLVGLKHWCHYFRDKTLILYVDNTQVMYMLTNTSSSKNVCLGWLKEIFWLCIDHNGQLQQQYIASKDNFVADALSRASGDKPVDAKRLQRITKDWCCSNLLLPFFDRWKDDTGSSPTPSMDLDNTSNKEM